MSFVEFLKKFVETGGFTSYLLIGTALVLVVVSISRLYYLYFILRPAGEIALQNLGKQVLKKEYTAAIQVCNSTSNVPEFEVIKSGLLAVDSGREAMKSSLGAAIVEIMKNCEKNIQLISLIASVATLLGLLGTISGMIKTFAAIAAEPTNKAEMLGLGISEAMNATATGLVIGISAMVVHTLCTQKIDQIIGQAKKTGYNLITMIEQSER
ncbi:MAG: MotA/TolQ/ExbB proton channel family protein [Bdellovibrionota bacterium]